MDLAQNNYDDLPGRARDIIAWQEQEIAALKQQLEHEHSARELKQLLLTTEAVSTILAPFSHERLLEIVVQTATNVMDAQAGSLFLLDDATNELVFQVAIGPAAREAKQFRVPVGHGIVGMVVLTGQPMAIANAQQDEHFAYDIASAINYIPHNIVCVPLFYDDHIIGALELLNKNTQESFSIQDMEMLGQFANIAAVAIAQSQAYYQQNTVRAKLLNLLRTGNMAANSEATHAAARLVDWLDSEEAGGLQAQKLAQLVHELLLAGKQEIELCTGILQHVVLFTRNRNPSHLHQPQL